MLGISLGVGMLLAATHNMQPTPSTSEQSVRAVKAAVEAAYKQTGAERELYELEREYIPEHVRIISGNAMILSRLVFENRIEFHLDF